jgi:hypothetical protein
MKRCSGFHECEPMSLRVARASLGVSGPESSPEKSAPARVRHQRRVQRGELFSRGWHVCSAYDGRRSAAGAEPRRDIGP